MHILIVSAVKIPVVTYGGTERVIWWLGRELVRLGHKVTFLVNEGSACPFADVIFIDHTKDIREQVPAHIDVAHFQFPVTGFTAKPYISTVHVNPGPHIDMDENSVFVSADHAARMGSDVFVYNGIGLEDYPLPDLSKKRVHTHFLAKAAWRLKNVKGAINISTMANEKLIIMGGTRLNIKMGFRFTPHLNTRFTRMVDNKMKATVMNSSKALIFPVLWHEPFGIAIIESLYYGCRVLGTPYGSLPELVPAEYGALSNSCAELANDLMKIGDSGSRLCHQYAADKFNAAVMTREYVELYERVLNGEKLSMVKPKAPTGPEPKFLPWYD
jgi:glycosyltransferase involved in cell wall biosynthesis